MNANKKVNQDLVTKIRELSSEIWIEAGRIAENGNDYVTLRQLQEIVRLLDETRKTATRF